MFSRLCRSPAAPTKWEHVLVLSGNVTLGGVRRRLNRGQHGPGGVYL